MERRNFLRGLGALFAVAVVAPADLLKAPVYPAVSFAQVNELTKKYIVPAMMDEVFRPSPLFARLRREHLDNLYDVVTAGHDKPYLLIMDHERYATFQELASSQRSLF